MVVVVVVVCSAAFLFRPRSFPLICFFPLFCFVLLCYFPLCFPPFLCSALLLSSALFFCSALFLSSSVAFVSSALFVFPALFFPLACFVPLPCWSAVFLCSIAFLFALAPFPLPCFLSLSCFVLLCYLHFCFLPFLCTGLLSFLWTRLGRMRPVSQTNLKQKRYLPENPRLRATPPRQRPGLADPACLGLTSMMNWNGQEALRNTTLLTDLDQEALERTNPRRELVVCLCFFFCSMLLG